jgi:hypothetical protein
VALGAWQQLLLEEDAGFGSAMEKMNAKLWWWV